MFLEDWMIGLGNYLGASADVAAMLVAVVCMLVVLAVLSYVAEIEGLPLFLSMVLLLGLFTVFVWIPAWIALSIFVLSVAFLLFGGEVAEHLGG